MWAAWEHLALKLWPWTLLSNLRFFSLQTLQPFTVHWQRVICLLLGREPSISSDTRTDSSTDSSSHRTSRSRPLHQSTGSHLSSESQTTVVCNYDTGTPPLGADAGGKATIWKSFQYLLKFFSCFREGKSTNTVYTVVGKQASFAAPVKIGQLFSSLCLLTSDASGYAPR